MDLLVPLMVILLAFTVGYIFISMSPEEVTEETKITKDRLKKIKYKTYDVKAEDDETKSKNLIAAFIEGDTYKYAAIGKILERLNYVNRLKHILKMADIKADTSQFIVMIIVLFAVGTFLGLLSPMKQVPWVMGIAIAGGLPFGMIKMRMAKRLTTFTAQLPDALGLIASSLRAGHSLNSAFSIVVHEMPDPIAGLFRVVCEDINLGRNTKEALENMIANMPGSIDLRFFVTAVLIQREIGGNLAEILDSLNDTIRERFKLLGQLKSQTAQASLSGIVLALAPLFIGGVIYLLNPQYMKPLFESVLGQGAIVLAFVLGIIGFAIIKKITTIRV